jgi:hypothetical protein
MPFQITPTFIAPVLAGETLKNGLVQARVLSEPIFNKVSGWWLEHYVFYVRVGDLLTQDTPMRDMLTGATTPWPYTAAAAPDYYHTDALTPDVLGLCLNPIVRAYFRDEGQEPADYILGSATKFAAGISGSTFFDSWRTETQIGGAPGGADTWAQQWTAYQAMRRARLTTATFEEYLAESGVSTPPKLRETETDLKVPELIRYVRDFTYPVPTFSQTTGDAVGVVQWTLTDRVDKQRFFAEPGFLVGLFVVRPKMFFGLQNQKIVDFYNTQAHWLPPELDTDPHASILNILASKVITGGDAANMYYDAKGLFLKGDQFLNVTPAGAASISRPNTVQLPSTTGANVRYPSVSDAQSVFSTANKFIVADGVVSLKIATRLMNTIA